MSRLKMFAALLIVAVAAAPISSQPGGKKKAPGGFSTADPEVEKLREEVARLRADLDALKAALVGPRRTVEKGPFYRGRPATYWLEQLKDFDTATRLTAVEAVGALAQADKNLIPPLIDVLKKDSHQKVLSMVAEVLGEVGPETLPALIELAKDKGNGKNRRYAFEAIGNMAEQAKPALPMLTAALKEPDPVVLRGAIIVLVRIGPDAKKAVPALVDTLGDSLTEIAKPDTGGRFGTTSTSINYLAFEAIRFLDADLVGDLTPPGTFRTFGLNKKAGAVKGGGFPGEGGPGGGRPGGGGPGGAAMQGLTPIEFANAWQKLHETLVKRYTDRK